MQLIVYMYSLYLYNGMRYTEHVVFAVCLHLDVMWINHIFCCVVPCACCLSWHMIRLTVCSHKDGYIVVNLLLVYMFYKHCLWIWGIDFHFPNTYYTWGQSYGKYPELVGGQIPYCQIFFTNYDAGFICVYLHMKLFGALYYDILIRRCSNTSSTVNYTIEVAHIS